MSTDRECLLEMAALMEALATPLDIPPAAARERLFEVCNKGSGAGWRQKLAQNDPVTQLENARLRFVIAVDDINLAIRSKAERLFPDLQNPSLEIVLDRVITLDSTRKETA